MEHHDATHPPRAEAAADDIPPAPEGSFGIVVLPDTQDYIPSAPEILEAEIRWVLENLRRQNIRFVCHVGDVVGDCQSAGQWRHARQIMTRLHGRVPFGICPGNRDMRRDGDSRAFQQTFPESLFDPFAWYGGCYKNNADSFQLISAEEIDLLIMHLECNAPDDVLKWANGVLTKHADRRAMVVTHMWLGPLEKPATVEGWFTDPKGRMCWIRRHGQRGNTPQQIWEKCLSRHANVFLICCGDQSRTQTMRQTSSGNGNRVHECLSDYRDGYLRLYRFLPRANRIDVFTYSPYYRRLCQGTDIAPEAGAHQFSLSCQLLG